MLSIFLSKFKNQNSRFLTPNFEIFDILESVGDMDPVSKGVDFLLRLFCFLSHSTAHYVVCLMNRIILQIFIYYPSESILVQSEQLQPIYNPNRERIHNLIASMEGDKTQAPALFSVQLSALATLDNVLRIKWRIC